MINLLKLLWGLVLLGNVVIAYGAALRFIYLWVKDRQGLLLILGMLVLGIGVGETTWLLGAAYVPHDEAVRAAMLTYGLFTIVAWTCVAAPCLFLSAYAFGLITPLTEGFEWIISRFPGRRSGSTIQ